MAKLFVAFALIMVLLNGSSFAADCFFEDAQIAVRDKSVILVKEAWMNIFLIILYCP